jgi:hypothetical protein
MLGSVILALEAIYGAVRKPVLTERDMPRPGQVSSDEQAFQQILVRLEGEVGTIFELIKSGKLEKGLFPKTAPFWRWLE